MQLTGGTGFILKVKMELYPPDIWKEQFNKNVRIGTMPKMMNNIKDWVTRYGISLVNNWSVLVLSDIPQCL